MDAFFTALTIMVLAVIALRIILSILRKKDEKVEDDAQPGFPHPENVEAPNIVIAHVEQEPEQPQQPVQPAKQIKKRGRKPKEEATAPRPAKKTVKKKKTM